VKVIDRRLRNANRSLGYYSSLSLKVSGLVVAKELLMKEAIIFL